MLTPSSNVVVEPWCARMALALPDTSVHFGRVEVLRIDDDDDADAQFQDSLMLEASALLAHTRPHVIGWNGTAAAWLGLARDRALTQGIAQRTGCRAVTSTLSIFEALASLGTARVGLVTPYVENMQDRIVANLESEGLICVAERHFDLTDNFSFGEVPEARVAEAAREVAAAGAEAVLIFCTNLAGAGVAAAVERETGRPVLDSVMLTVWGALRAIGQGTEALAPWGPTVAALSPPDTAATEPLKD